MHVALTPDETVLAIDPGNTESAYCLLSGAKKILGFGKVPNESLRNFFGVAAYDHLAIEMIASYGMPVGKEVFETCIQIGRLMERSGRKTVNLITRLQVKMAVCHSPKANDSTIRTALIDLYGAPGKKSAPGPTYGITADCWAALALAETFRSGNYTPYILSECQK